MILRLAGRPCCSALLCFSCASLRLASTLRNGVPVRQFLQSYEDFCLVGLALFDALGGFGENPGVGFLPVLFFRLYPVRKGMIDYAAKVLL
jgi:hypothetical protein